MVTSKRAGRLRVIAALGTALAILSAACGGDSSRTEYKDPNDLALFEVPNDWNVYDVTEVSTQPVLPFAGLGGQLASVFAFDAAPLRNVANLSAPIASARYPLGSYVVREILPEERDVISNRVLETLVIQPELYTVLDRGPLQQLDFGNDFEGIGRILLFEDVITQERGQVYFVSVTNPDDSVIYSMAAGCSRRCFEEFINEIAEVIGSWVVNTRT